MTQETRKQNEDLKKPRWYGMTEDEKVNYALHIALSACQASYLKFIELLPEAKEYIQLQKDIIDWVSLKTGTSGLPLYEGEGINGTFQYLKQNDTGDTNVNEQANGKETN